jgi:hypothetical protein
VSQAVAIEGGQRGEQVCPCGQDEEAPLAARPWTASAGQRQERTPSKARRRRSRRPCRQTLCGTPCWARRATGGRAWVDASGGGRTRSGEQRPGSTCQKAAGGKATAMGTGRRGRSFGSGHEHSRHSPYKPGGWPGRGRRGEAVSARRARRGRREREIRPAAPAELPSSPWSQEPSGCRFGVFVCVCSTRTRHHDLFIKRVYYSLSYHTLSHII